MNVIRTCQAKYRISKLRKYFLSAANLI